MPVMVVMGEKDTSRGAIATASYAARKFGVHSAMSVARARQLCPQGIYLPVRHSLYREYSQKVMAILSASASRLEQVSIDEAYLDLSELGEDPEEIVTRLQQQITGEIGLTASVGLATNKLVAKMASGFRKPAGLTVVAPGDEADFLAPLPVGKLFGVGPKSAARLNAMNILTIGDLAEAELAQLQATFGPNLGHEMKEHATGEDHRPVVTFREAKSLSFERTFFEDVADHRLLWRYIQEMAVGLEGSLQKKGLLARTVAIKLRFNNWKTITRAETLLSPTATAQVIAASAARLMRQSWKRGTPLRLIGVRVSNFVEEDAPRQLEFALE